MTDFSAVYAFQISSIGGSLALGRYKSIGKRGKLSFYGGATLGSYGQTNNRNTRNSFILPYAGLNIGLRTKYLEPVFTTRLSHNTYLRDLGRIDRAYPALESAITLRFGAKNLKFHSQLGISYPLDSQSGYGFYIANVGLTYRFVKKNKSHLSLSF